MFFVTRRVSRALLIMILCARCASNPALHPAPNNELLAVTEDEGFTRGGEKIDEEDFYQLTGDTESAQVVHSSRSTGEVLQAVGMTALIIGAAVLAGSLGVWVLSGNGDPPPITLSESQTYYPYIGAGIGAVVLAAGIVMFGVVGKPKADGSQRVFDVPHAQASIETGRYGKAGLTPELIKSLSITAESGSTKFCGSAPLTLDVLGATDAEGRPVKTDTRGDWFAWSATPADAYHPSVQPGAQPTIDSPMKASLLNVDQAVAVTATVKATGVTTTTNFVADLTCGGQFGFSGAAGRDGESGKEGKSGHKGPGTAGLDGINGNDGHSGLDVEAEAAWVSLPNHPKLMLIAVQGQNGIDTLLVEAGTEVTIASAGGPGGDGGKGGKGGSGDSPGYNVCGDGSSGGNGGRGGTGGRGGDGGNVTIRVSDAALQSAISASAPGGRGGGPGGAGSGGSGGVNHQNSCPKGVSTHGGQSGQSGGSGQSGNGGRPGKVDVKVTSASSLRLISKLIDANPGMSLLGGDDSSGSKPKRRR